MPNDLRKVYDYIYLSEIIPMSLRDKNTIAERRKALEDIISFPLRYIGSSTVPQDEASKKNCENMIGMAQIPIGVAGPLKIGDEEVYLPLATTEGALVASVNRGSKAITQSGGALTESKRVGISRAPVFAVASLTEVRDTTTWVEKKFDLLQKITNSTSSHLKLLSQKSWIIGRNVFIRFVFDSQDAMGMNMATIATTLLAKEIEKNTQARLVAISGNMCVDKKPNMLNVLEGRGIQAWAEVVLSKDSIQNTLKTTPEKLVEVVTRKIYLGSLFSGSIGANAHAANVLAAIFLATGQDIAHIAEVSAVFDTAEIDNNGVYFSVFLPDLVIGTVGGGTNLPTQQEALRLLGVAGGNEGKNAEKFAEIIAGAVLAGEISLAASLSVGSLAAAHIQLGRGGEK